MEVAELLLKSNYFEFNDKFKKDKEGNTIGNNLLPFIPLFPWLSQRKKFWGPVLKNLGCGGGTWMIFMIWRQGENKFT